MTTTQPNPLDAARMSLADQAKLAATDFKAYVQMMAALGPDRLRSALMGALGMSEEAANNMIVGHVGPAAAGAKDSVRDIRLPLSDEDGRSIAQWAMIQSENARIAAEGLVNRFRTGTLAERAAAIGSMLEPDSLAAWDLMVANGECSRELAEAAKDIVARRDETRSQVRQEILHGIDVSGWPEAEKERIRRVFEGREGQAFIEREVRLREARRLAEEAEKNHGSPRIAESAREQVRVLVEQQQADIRSRKIPDIKAAKNAERMHDAEHTTDDTSHWKAAAKRQAGLQKSGRRGPTPEQCAGLIVMRLLAAHGGDQNDLEAALEREMSGDNGKLLRQQLAKATATADGIADPEIREAMTLAGMAAKQKGLLSEKVETDIKHAAVHEADTDSGFSVAARLSKSPDRVLSNLASRRSMEDEKTPEVAVANAPAHRSMA